MADQPDDDPDADLIAYLDGELDGPDAAAVEERLALDPDARAKAEAYKKTFGLLDYLPRPEPSPDFATRTLTKLQPVVGSGTATAPVVFSGSLPVMPAAPPGRAGWVAWAVAAVVAAGGAYAAHAALRPYVEPPPRDALGFDDVRVVENLPLYLGVDDLAFLRQLDAPDLFAPDPFHAPADPTPKSAPAERDKLVALFKSYPPGRQQQLRDLDEQFRALPQPEKERLGRVLDAYAVWLDRLPDADRKEVLSAPSPAARLDAVDRVAERAWRDRLPAQSKELLKRAGADFEKQLQLAEGWRLAERARRDEWVLARRQWHVLADPARKPWPFDAAALTREVDEFVARVLKADLSAKYQKPIDVPATCRLTWEEHRRLRDISDGVRAEGQWSWLVYGWKVHELATAHPSLPEPRDRSPVTEFGPVQALVSKDGLQALRQKAAGPQWDRRLAKGKWPEFALEVAGALRAAGQPVPEGLGPARPGKFTPEVDAFLTQGLGPKLTDAEKDGLRRLEGKWPEYPRQVLKLAEQYDLPVPGVTLPGKPSEWARLYPLPRAKRE